MDAITSVGVGYPAIIMAVLGVAFGALLAFASIKFFVPVDERVSKIRAALPGANCGSCGYPGCDGYADGVVNEGAPVNKCAPGGAAAVDVIANVMGVSAGSSEPMRAFLKCKGTPTASPRNCEYEGVADCRSAVIVPGTTPNACPFGCIGLGTCVKVCSFGALSIKDGLAYVDPVKCVGCGACIEACPKGVLSLIPSKSSEMVLCNSKWRGPEVKKVCSVGCIGCGLCVRNCPSEAITLNANLAVIDGTKCTGCGTCIEKCPVKNIEKVKKTA